MNTQRTVTIIGGGIAGLSAAVFLTEKNFKVELLEASPKLGGRAYSFFDKERDRFFDNGQHILAGWYKNTFEYLKIIGSHDKLNFQKNLEINFVNTEKKVYKLRCPDAAPPMNLLYGLLKFKAFDLKDKFALKNIMSLLNDDIDHDRFANTAELLKSLKQTYNVVKYFWEPFILAVFNTQPEKVSVRVFLNVLKTGFNEKSSSTLVIPDVNLNELLVDPAVKYFEKNDVKVILDRTVKQIVTGEGTVVHLSLDDDTKINSDFYISAVSFFAFKRLFNENVYLKNNYRSEFLKASGIVSVHIFFETKIPEKLIQDNSFGMTGLIGTIVQWIFKRNENHLSLVISGADDLQITEMSSEDIYKLCIKDLMQTITGFDKLKISGYKVIKEKRATFIPDNATNEFRPKQKTDYDNFFIAGDWTDTDLPATIESAVSSAKWCVEEIVKS
ncbi:MAG: hydroxysqualene dehydroxylase HpnE [Ignavibacteria bacterium]